MHLTISLVTTGKIMTIEELNNVKGRAWEDVDVSSASTNQCYPRMQSADIRNTALSLLWNHVVGIVRVAT